MVGFSVFIQMAYFSMVIMNETGSPSGPTRKTFGNCSREISTEWMMCFWWCPTDCAKVFKV